MADIFVSYAPRDRQFAAPFIERLEARGWNIGRHPETSPDAPPQTEKTAELAAVRCVLALWTANSVASQRVNADARASLRRQTLISVRLEEVQLPLAFRQTRSCDLFDQPDGADEHALDALMSALRLIIEGPALAAVKRSPRSRLSRGAVLTIAVALVMATTVGIWAMRPGQETLRREATLPATSAPSPGTASPR